MTELLNTSSRHFDAAFREALRDLVLWRRDVRRFRRDPVHLAVFSDETTRAGAGLGRQTMPETLRYSVVAAVQTLWLAARAEGLGVGWISILEPKIVCRILDVPEAWTLVAYLCVGRPAE